MQIPRLSSAAALATLLFSSLPAAAEPHPDGAAPVPERASEAPVEAAAPLPASPPTLAPAPMHAHEASAEAAAPLPMPAIATPWYRLRGVAELGFLAVLSHKIQLGKTGTYFDYATEGGQDNLYAVSRLSAEAELFGRHQIVFLYQPLELNTSAQLRQDVRINSVVFPKGTLLNSKYGFPFYRLSYAYDLIKDPRHELSIGLSLQIRNATVEFTSGDGKLFASTHNIGPVPILRSRGRYTFENDVFVGYEVDGFYAPIKGANGSDNAVIGAIIDGSVRAGVRLPLHAEAFINLRYLGGGSEGQGDPTPLADGYNKNWLSFLTVSLGAAIATF
jgi:hypothetical protein